MGLTLFTDGQRHPSAKVLVTNEVYVLSKELGIFSESETETETEDLGVTSNINMFPTPAVKILTPNK